MVCKLSNDLTPRSSVEPPRGIYAARANKIIVKHHLGRIVAVIEILSPEIKIATRSSTQDFVEKAVDFLEQGIQTFLLLISFPRSVRDPFGIHKVIWDEFLEEDFTFPEGKDRILASYESGVERVAYVEPVAVGDDLPEMPLFLARDLHILVPLEPTYRAAWEASPEEMRTAVETGILPEAEEE